MDAHDFEQRQAMRRGNDQTRHGEWLQFPKTASDGQVCETGCEPLDERHRRIVADLIVAGGEADVGLHGDRQCDGQHLAKE